jgi:hypothetical protein
MRPSISPTCTCRREVRFLVAAVAGQFGQLKFAVGLHLQRAAVGQGQVGATGRTGFHPRPHVEHGACGASCQSFAPGADHCTGPETAVMRALVRHRCGAIGLRRGQGGDFLHHRGLGGGLVIDGALPVLVGGGAQAAGQMEQVGGESISGGGAGLLEGLRPRRRGGAGPRSRAPCGMARIRPACTSLGLAMALN